jgi:hypothetical protein
VRRSPQVTGLVLCNRIEIRSVPPRPAEMTLAGLFLRLNLPAFPSQPLHFTVYGILQSGAGAAKMTLSITQLETENDIYVYERWHSWSAGTTTMHLEVQVRGCAFPVPGKYRLSLCFDRVEVASRLLDVGHHGVPT